jgi:hypothetical protein
VIRGHTLSSKGARLVRSTEARAASPLRNATSAVCRLAAIKKDIKNQENNWLSDIKSKHIHIKQTSINNGSIRARQDWSMGPTNGRK